MPALTSQTIESTYKTAPRPAAGEKCQKFRVSLSMPLLPHTCSPHFPYPKPLPRTLLATRAAAASSPNFWTRARFASSYSARATATKHRRRGGCSSVCVSLYIYDASQGGQGRRESRIESACSPGTRPHVNFWESIIHRGGWDITGLHIRLPIYGLICPRGYRDNQLIAVIYVWCIIAYILKSRSCSRCNGFSRGRRLLR